MPPETPAKIAAGLPLHLTVTPDFNMTAPTGRPRLVKGQTIDCTGSDVSPYNPFAPTKPPLVFNNDSILENEMTTNDSSTAKVVHPPPQRAPSQLNRQQLFAQRGKQAISVDSPDWHSRSSSPRRPSILNSPCIPRHQTTLIGSSSSSSFTNGISISPGRLGSPGSSRAQISYEQRYREMEQSSGSLQFSDNKPPIHVFQEELEVIQPIGSGTYGTVVKMRLRRTGHEMAVKQLRRTSRDEENKRTFTDVDIVRKCSCPEIVRFYGFFITTSDIWICMELMATCFDRLIRKAVSCIPEHVLGVLSVSTVRALNYLKERHNIIHRDVKPSNILISDCGKIKLCDFSLSGELVDSQAKTRSAGCYAYLSPERVDTNVSAYDIRADVWSLGISLIELATGEHPYKDYQVAFELMARIVDYDAPTLDGDFSSDFKLFVSACLAKKQEERPKYTQLMTFPFYSYYDVPMRAKEDPFEIRRWIQPQLSRMHELENPFFDQPITIPNTIPPPSTLPLMLNSGAQSSSPTPNSYPSSNNSIGYSRSNTPMHPVALNPNNPFLQTQQQLSPAVNTMPSIHNASSGSLPAPLLPTPAISPQIASAPSGIVGNHSAHSAASTAATLNAAAARIQSTAQIATAAISQRISTLFSGNSPASARSASPPRK